MDKLRAAALCLLLSLLVPAANAATTLTATPASVIPGGTETAAWSGIATPTTSDWLGLYAPGAANTSYLTYRYTNGAASGSVPFTIPAWIAPGTYELRLLANGGYTALATSNVFTVSSRTVSGTVTANGSPLPGVVFAATNGGNCTNSNGSGQYTCTVPQGWSGTVTPSLSIYSFTPTSRTYSNVTTNQTAQNYTAVAPPTTLNATPANVAPGAAVTAAWSGIPVPASSDWLGLYVPGTGNYLSWRYTNGAASGSVPFTIPGTVAAGTYQLRLFQGASTYLATSNNFTVNVSVSGTVTLGGSPLAGVAFTASNGGTCTTSNASGQYSCSVPPGWSGSVTPTPGSHVFTPASRNYTNVTAHQTAQNYTATVAYQVSGTVTIGGSPLPGVAFAATNGGICTSSNASGQYSCTVAQGWSGTVTPTLATHTFSPPSRNYSNVTAHQTAQGYASVIFQVSGTVTASGSPLAGVALVATNGVTCTSSNASGQFSCTALQGWSGDVTPHLSGYLFTPGWRTYTPVTAHQTAQDYTAAPIVQVSGAVTLNGAPLANVAVGATNGGSCSSSNASGQYSCAVPQGWSGTVTPWLTGYTFTPASRNHANVTGALTGQDYAATEGGGAAAMFYIHTDHLNTPRVISNGTSQVVWRWDHAEPFGSFPANDNPNGLGAFEFNLRFPGQYFDMETNLHYNYFRDYDPGIGRYVQSDPIGLEGGINTYAYATGNPVFLADPFGLEVRIVGKMAVWQFGRITNPNSYHLAIYVDPDNKTCECKGISPMTIGAQRSWWGQLVTEFNYPGDNPSKSTIPTTIVSTPPGMTDCQFIKNIIATANRYQNNVRYSSPSISPFPGMGDGSMSPFSYNSNSFVSGVISGAGGTPPSLNSGGSFQAPGYSNPLPIPPAGYYGRGF